MGQGACCFQLWHFGGLSVWYIKLSIKAEIVK